MKPLVPAAILLVLTIGGGAPAAACTCVEPRGGQFLVPAEVEIPANAVGIPWFGTLSGPGAGPGSVPVGTFTVRELSGEESTPAPARVELLREGPISSHEWIALVSPAGGFRPGAVYELDYQPPTASEDWLQGTPHKVKVTVSRERLTFRDRHAEVTSVDKGRELLHVLTNGGSCSARVLAHQVGLELRLPPGLERWRSALLFGTSVDGKTWRPSGSWCTTIPPGRSWVGLGSELAFSACRPAPEPLPEGLPPEAYVLHELELDEAEDPRTAAAPGFNLPEGDHRVEMIGWLPGTDAVLRGSTRIRLHCPDTGEPAAGGQPPASNGPG